MATKGVSKAFAESVQKVVRSVRSLKDDATGVSLSRLHRVESELMTVAGRKSPRRSKRSTATAAKKKAPTKRTK